MLIAPLCIDIDIEIDIHLDININTDKDMNIEIEKDIDEEIDNDIDEEIDIEIGIDADIDVQAGSDGAAWRQVKLAPHTLLQTNGRRLTCLRAAASRNLASLMIFLSVNPLRGK